MFLSAGPVYSLCLQDSGDGIRDTHSFDLIVDLYAAYTLKTMAPSRFGLFAYTGILWRNPLFPEASNYIIYDFVSRAVLMAGPFAAFSLGRFEPYLGAGPAVLGILVSHNEKTPWSGDARYERFEVNTGAGIMAGSRFIFEKKRRASITSAPFINFGVQFVFYFSNYLHVTSKYDEYAGFTKPFVMPEIRPFFTAGFILGGKRESSGGDG